MTTGRNDPCPCGSGKKYKKCHLNEDLAARTAGVAPEKSPIHDLDNRIMEDLIAFLEVRFPAELEDELDYLEEDPNMHLQFGLPWLAYSVPFGDRSGVAWYLEARGDSLSRRARAWLEAGSASWLSIWAVDAVAPGQIMLVDQLTGVERTVREVAAAEVMQPGQRLLTRVVDFDRESLLVGVYPLSVRSLVAGNICERIRKAVRLRNVVPAERLRNPRIARRLYEEWSEAAEAAMRAPRLTNTSGDEVLLTEVRWRIAPESREAIAASLRAMDGVREDQGDLHFLSDDDTVLGTVTIEDRKVRLETNSVRRADALSSRIESECGDLLGRSTRSHSDPLALLGAGTPSAPLEHTEEASAFVREYKERHYAAWLDDAIPAFGGQTPRAAVRTKEGRRRVEALLDDMERMEASLPEGERFDVDILRRALGLE